MRNAWCAMLPSSSRCARSLSVNYVQTAFQCQHCEFNEISFNWLWHRCITCKCVSVSGVRPSPVVDPGIPISLSSRLFFISIQLDIFTRQLFTRTDTHWAGHRHTHTAAGNRLIFEMRTNIGAHFVLQIATLLLATHTQHSTTQHRVQHAAFTLTLKQRNNAQKVKRKKKWKEKRHSENGLPLFIYYKVYKYNHDKCAPRRTHALTHTAVAAT